jgi:hypothetical protein
MQAYEVEDTLVPFNAVSCLGEKKAKHILFQCLETKKHRRIFM